MNCLNEYTILSTNDKAECKECGSVVDLSEFQITCYNKHVEDERKVNIDKLVEDLEKLYYRLFKKCENPRITEIRNMDQCQKTL